MSKAYPDEILSSANVPIHCDQCDGIYRHTYGCPNEPDAKSGVWFESSVTGMRYRNRNAAGDVQAIIIDGELFEVSCR